MAVAPLEIRTKSGRLQATQRRDWRLYRDDKPELDRLHWYILVVQFGPNPEDSEEIDIDAESPELARKLGRIILKKEYQDGGKIVETVLA